MYIHLVQDYGIEVDVAQHLASSYGDRAFVVARMCKMTGRRWPIVGSRLHEEFPYLDAEVKYAIREYAVKIKNKSKTNFLIIVHRRRCNCETFEIGLPQVKNQNKRSKKMKYFQALMRRMRSSTKW
jgi:hypothetical protein